MRTKPSGTHHGAFTRAHTSAAWFPALEDGVLVALGVKNAKRAHPQV